MDNDERTTQADALTVSKAPKHRSPSYPSINLQKAIERTKELSTVAGRHAAPVSAALSAWGYSSKSSGGQLTAAAVKKFGLVADEGTHAQRQLRLTQLGHELVFYDSDRDSPAWVQRAQEAALMPTIHRELWDKYDGQLPADSVILPYLVLDRKFSEGAASEVLRVLRATVSFAKMAKADGTASVSEHEPDAIENEIVPPAALSEPQAQTHEPVALKIPSVVKPQRTIQVPYSPGQWALVQAAFPITGAAWDQMIAVLEVMRPGLVVDES
jgi:hypothetical protein